MFCTQCGKQLEPAARFCSACGTSFSPVQAPSMASVSPLMRPRQPRLIAGVCAAFADHYGWDLSVTRVITALMIAMTGVGAFAYLAAWIIIPEAPYALPLKSA